MTKTFQPLNHTSQCLQQWREMMSRPGFSRLAEHTHFVELYKQLESAPKFMLPEGGRPVEDPGALSRMFSEIRMPFPCVALEYRVDDGPIAEHEGKSSKRIALVWDLRSGVPPVIAALNGMDTTPRKSLLVQSIYEMDSQKMWMANLGQIEIVTDQPTTKGSMSDLGKTDPQLYDMVKHRAPDHNKQTFTYPAIAHVSSPELLRTYADKAIDLVTADSSDEVLAAISFGAITACANVSFQTHEVDKKVNERRIKQGKSPLFDMRILEVDVRSNAYLSKDSPAPHSGQGHASPRAHLRRGHVRRLEDKTVWVNAAIVNAETNTHNFSTPSPAYRVSRDRQG